MHIKGMTHNEMEGGQSRLQVKDRVRGVQVRSTGKGRNINGQEEGFVRYFEGLGM